MTRKDTMSSGPNQRFLIVPGLGGSDATHWQAHWERKLHAQRVQQDNWDQPSLDSWLVRLVQEIGRSPNAILIGHSLGCILIAHLAKRFPSLPVKGAFLVAPADIEKANSLSETLASFLPLALSRFSFPSMVIASTNDPYTHIERARIFSQTWGAHFVDIGPQGHINSASGFGPWPLGLQFLLAFSVRIATPSYSPQKHLSLSADKVSP